MCDNKYVINLSDVVYNFDTAKSLAGSAGVIPVLKAAGYGMGAKKIADTLFKARGVPLFAVSRLDEALELKSGDYEVLVLSPVFNEQSAKAAVLNNFITAVSSVQSAYLLNAAAKGLGAVARAHIALDTGFGRYGFTPDNAEQIMGLKDFDNIKITGVYSHLYAAFDKDAKKSLNQLSAFTAITQRLEAQYGPLTKHIANSSAVAKRLNPFMLDAVRIGSMLCGRLPFNSGCNLRPVGTLCCPITQIKELPRGHNIGYGGIFSLKRASRVAVINAGSADGILRTKGYDTFRPVDFMRYGYNIVKMLFKDNRLKFEINGKKAPVLGRVALTNTMLDVTDIDCKAGDIAALKISPLAVDKSIKREYINE